MSTRYASAESKGSWGSGRWLIVMLLACLLTAAIISLAFFAASSYAYVGTGLGIGAALIISLITALGWRRVWNRIAVIATTIWAAIILIAYFTLAMMRSLNPLSSSPKERG